MQLIEQSHKIWGRCPSDPKKALRWIERAGRVCYASEDKIAEDSAEPFVRKLIERGHLSVLEHSELTLQCAGNVDQRHRESKYMDLVLDWSHGHDMYTGNLRGWIETSNKNFLDTFLTDVYKNNTDRLPLHLRRYTVEFTTNRAMTHELVRHRLCSFSQESQRYVRYDNMKFIKPIGFDEWSDEVQEWFKYYCYQDESAYRCMLGKGLTPQQARNILPNAAATRIVVTADRQEWGHIFKLRCGGGADPQMIALMVPVRDEMMKLWEDENG